MRELRLSSSQRLERRGDVQVLDFSSRKVFNWSRVQREAPKVGGYQFKSVTEALSYEECDIVHNVCAIGSSYPPCLNRVLEHDGVGKDLNIGDAIIYEDCNQKVSYFNFQLVVC